MDPLLLLDHKVAEDTSDEDALIQAWRTDTRPALRAGAGRFNELRATRDDRQASVQADLDDARTVGYAARRAHVLHVGR
jgi:hypothetical protein